MKAGFAVLDILNLRMAIAIAIAGGLLVEPTRAGNVSSQPNIVLILADDLGWSDLGCYGADLHETPHIDHLASQGVRFTRAYAMSVCSPTRAMLMTGRHAARLGMTVWIEASLKRNTNRQWLDASSLHNLPHVETTLASRLRESGYFTALVGKWHLGDADHFPETHGFDINIGGNHWGAPTSFWWPYRGSGRFGVQYRYVPQLDFGQPGEYLTDRLTDEAIQVIDRAVGNKQPFFLYLSHYAPHTPIEAKTDHTEHFASKIRSEMHHQHPVYAAMVKSLDESVGRIVDHLEKNEIDQNTIVIFSSDNGGYVGVDQMSGYRVPVTNNAPLRSGKGSLYEGGIRVPLIVRWPGVTAAGQSCAVPVSLADIYPTLTRAPMADDPKVDRSVDDEPPTLDGVDLRELLQDPSSRLEREALYFHYPHYYATTTPASAVLRGDWKLIEYFENGRTELFDLRSDPSEQNNLADEERNQVKPLKALLDHWRTDVGARLPQPNPDFQPKR